MSSSGFSQDPCSLPASDLTCLGENQSASVRTLAPTRRHTLLRCLGVKLALHEPEGHLQAEGCVAVPTGRLCKAAIKARLGLYFGLFWGPRVRAFCGAFCGTPESPTAGPSRRATRVGEMVKVGKSLKMI